MPLQVGVGVAGGAESAVHVTHRLLNNLPDDHVLVKLDFKNAFNSIRRDLILQSVAENIPEIYRFVHASLDCNSKLAFGTDTILSSEGSQQGDPLGSLEFCEAIQQTLLSKIARISLGYIDDVNLEGRVDEVARNVQAIIDSSTKTGLSLNESKCQQIFDDETGYAAPVDVSSRLV